MQKTLWSESSVPATLLKISRFAMFSAQVAGYLPLSVNSKFDFLSRSSPNKRSSRRGRRSNLLLYHSWYSIPSLSSYIGLLLMIIWTTLYYVIFKPKIRFVQIFGPTEKFAYTLIVVVGTFMGIYLRARAFMGNIPAFFQENCVLLQHFEKLGLKLKEIAKIPKYIRISFLAYLIPLVIHCLALHAYRPIKAYFKYRVWLPDIVYGMGSGLWLFWSFLFISNLWIILFPLIYSACYKEISKDIRARFQNLNERPKNDASHPSDMKNKVSYSSFWHLSEITRNPKKPRPNKGANIQQEIQTLGNAYQQLQRRRKMVRNDIDIDRDEELESRVEGYLELILHLGEMIDRFNEEFGERLLLEMIFCIVFIIVYTFYICFWINQGEIFIIADVLTPIYINGKKLVELGHSCGNISREAQIAMKTLVDNVPLDKLSLGLTRKIRLIQIQMESRPPTVSAKQFFTLSRGSVTTVLSGMAGFVAALVQFRQGE